MTTNAQTPFARRLLACSVAGFVLLSSPPLRAAEVALEAKASADEGASVTASEASANTSEATESTVEAASDEAPAAADASAEAAEEAAAKAVEPTAEAAEVADVTEASEAAAAPAAEAKPATRSRKLDTSEMRFRGGFAFQLGAMVGEVYGPGFGIAAQLGIQLNDLLAVFWEPAVSAGFGIDDGIRGFAAFNNAVMADATLFDWLQLSAGGGIDRGTYGFCENDACGSETGWFPNISARLALIAVNRATGESRRRGFTFSITSHNTIVDSRVFSTVYLGVGGTWY